jgi:hypothetical protein
MLLFRVHDCEAREEKGRTDWPLRDRIADRKPPSELCDSVLEMPGILHAIDMIIESASFRCTCLRLRRACRR